MRGSVLAAIAAAVLVSGCWRSTSTTADQPQTEVEVENRSSYDVSVYVVPGVGPRRRLGNAPAHATTRLTIPANLLFGPTALRFQADPVGSARAPLTREITVTPGDNVVWIIPAGAASP